MLLPLVALSFVTLAPSSLPQTIDIATSTQAVNINGEYALDDGLLYHRADEHAAWALVDGVGLPQQNRVVLPEVKGKLRRVFADGNVVVVVDEQDQVFRFDTALHVLDTEPTLYAWRTIWGGPGLLKIPKDLKSVSFGRRSILNVGVVEDRVGDVLLASNPSSLVSVFHENGFTGLMHLYGLSADGKRLFFADNGLADVFNYEFDLPTAPDFEGVSLASSASMVVVLDSKGRFWAKFLDFDWYGSNPMMFDYSYAHDEPKQDESSKKAPEGFGRIHIPLPTWRELPAISLTARASFSSEMGVTVTGHGNNARRLSVRGIDDAGTCGLYTLDLDQSHWGFHATGICPKEPFTPSTKVTTTSRTKTLSGELQVGGKNMHATLSGYSLVDSPARLELRDSTSGQIAFRGALHMVPAWSPLGVKDPGQDGRYKLMYATVEADDDFADSAFARAHNLNTFDFTVYAAQDEVVVKELRKDARMGRLTSEAEDRKDEVSSYLSKQAEAQGVAGACRELRARIVDDNQQLLVMTSAAPALNVVGLVTGTRFWYQHGISMIPPLGRMMDWGTRLLYDRYQLTRYELQQVDAHCAHD